MLSIYTKGSTHIITAKEAPSFDAVYFDVTYLKQNGLVCFEKKGRATTYFFNYQQDNLVLRHYWRGGMISKLLSDQYLFIGLENTRTYKEFKLLIEMDALGLPVPTAVAAKITQTGLIYRGDIITKALPDALSLLDIIKQRHLTQDELKQTAQVIAQFHNVGVNHADLNINNILISQGRVFLIDFDRGTLTSPSCKTALRNINRLKRSFSKESQRNASFYWHENDWQTLHSHYLNTVHFSEDEMNKR